MALRLPATMDVEADTLQLPPLPRVSVKASTAADRGCGAAGGSGVVGRCGGRDTSTVATEADCCHCLVVTVDRSNESAALWINVDAATLRLPPRRWTAAIASYHRQREARELTEVAVAVRPPATMDVEAATLWLPPLPRVSVEASTTADGAGSEAAVSGGSVGRRGGRDTSTAATEAETFRLRCQVGTSNNVEEATLL